MQAKTVPESDQLLIERSVKREPVAMFSGVVHYTLRDLSWYQEDLKPYMVGRTLLDLGSGNLGFRTAQQLLGRLARDEDVDEGMLDLDITDVVAVDPFHSEKLMRAWAQEGVDTSSIRYDGRDALTFLIGQESGSANIMINAMDNCVVPYDYSFRVAEEAFRVVPAGGILITNQSEDIAYRARELFPIAFRGFPGREEYFSK